MAAGADAQLATARQFEDAAMMFINDLEAQGLVEIHLGNDGPTLMFRNPATGAYDVRVARHNPLFIALGDAIEDGRGADGVVIGRELMQMLQDILREYMEGDLVADGVAQPVQQPIVFPMLPEPQQPQIIEPAVFEPVPESKDKAMGGKLYNYSIRKMNKDKGAYSEEARKREMAWYTQALNKRQDAVTDGAYGYDGSGMSRWAMSADYQQHELQDKAALRMAERRAKQNWLGAKVFRPFWGNGLMG